MLRAETTERTAVDERGVAGASPPLLGPPSVFAGWDRPIERLHTAAMRLAWVIEELSEHDPRWRTPGFAACVERIRGQLRPIQSRDSLEASFCREALPHAATEAAYAIRWLELAGVTSGESWLSLIGAA